MTTCGSEISSAAAESLAITAMILISFCAATGAELTTAFYALTGYSRCSVGSVQLCCGHGIRKVRIIHAGVFKALGVRAYVGETMR